MSDNNAGAETKIAIVGMGCMFPQSKDPHEYWRLVQEGQDAITDIPDSHWKWQDYYNPDPKAPDMTYARRGGFLLPYHFDPLKFGIAPSAIESTDTSQLLGMVVAHEALCDAGYDPLKGDFDRDRVSCVLGVTGTLELVIPLGARLGHPIWRRALMNAGVDTDVAEQVIEEIKGSYVGWQESSFPGLLGNVVAGRIANKLNLGGTNTVVDSACGSSLSALHVAAMELSSGRADMVITGGVDTFNDIFMFVCFSKTPALSPTGDVRPFDKNADGTILGEGVGMVILKRLKDAEQAGDRIYAVLSGIGTSSDGKGQAIYAPSPLGQAKAIERAYVSAGVKATDIDMVEGHGTGTKAGDNTELSALNAVYRRERSGGSWCAIGSVKAQIGHTKAAAGAAGIIKTSLALWHKVLPPTIKVSAPAPALAASPFYLNDKAQPWIKHPEHPRRAAVSSFGFGGSNFHCVLEEASSTKPAADFTGAVQIMTWSAPDLASLKQMAQQAALRITSPAELRAAAYDTRSAYHHDDAHRLCIVVAAERYQEINDELAAFLRGISADTMQAQAPMGMFYSRRPSTGKLAIMFPGQGAQYPAMLRDLALRFPPMTTALDEAELAFYHDSGQTQNLLSKWLYPAATFSDAEREKQSTDLRLTSRAQPAIGAVSAGAYNVLRSFGITGDLVGGHSYGELVALYAGGVIDYGTLMKLSVWRGRLMADQGGAREPSGMLAVTADAAAVTRLLTNHQLALVLANLNTPQQTVLAGASAEIERGAVIYQEAGFKVTKLGVSAAFHSAFVQDAVAPLIAVMADCPFHRPKMSVFNNSTAAPYGDDPAANKELLAHQLAKPVQFYRQVQAMYAAGARCFVEVGPSRQLAGLMRACLKEYGDDVAILSLDARSGSPLTGDGRLQNLAELLAQLACRGFQVALSKWDEAFQRPEPTLKAQEQRFTMAICGANYVAPRAHQPAPKIIKTPKPPLQAPSQDRGSVMEKTIEEHRNDHGSVEPTQPQPRDPHILQKLLGSLEKSQESLLALQKMQQDSATIHHKFLEQQSQNQQMFGDLIKQQHQLLSHVIGGPARELRAPLIWETKPASPLTASTPKVEPPAAEHHHHTEGVKAHVAAAPQPPGETSHPHDSTDDVQRLVLDIISQKTGYPVAMIHVGMALEDDLGIDSIKRVEIFSELQMRVPGLHNIDQHAIAGIKTISEIIALTHTQSGSAAATTQEASPQVEIKTIVFDKAGAPAVGQGPLQELIDIIAEKTGYPAPMIGAQMDLENDLGIDSIKRVEIFSALSEKGLMPAGFSSEISGSLGTIADVVAYIEQGRATNNPLNQPNAALAGAPISLSSVPSPEPAPSITDSVIGIIADKTGYPATMINSSMHLENDLGIDSIKRVEIFADLATKFPGPTGASHEQMATLATVGAIIEALSPSPSHQPSLPRGDRLDTAVLAQAPSAPAKIIAPPAMQTESQAQAQAQAQAKEMKTAQHLTGQEQNVIDEHNEPQPVPMPSFPSQEQQATTSELRSSADFTMVVERLTVQALTMNEHVVRPALDIKTPSRIWVIDDSSPLATHLMGTLKEKGHRPRPVSLEYLDRIDEPEQVDGILVIVPHFATEEAAFKYHEELLALLKFVDSLMLSHPRQRFVTVVTSMGGKFGLDGKLARLSCFHAGLGGMIKCAAKEGSSTTFKVIDIDSSIEDHKDLAGRIVVEALTGGPLEVGLDTSGTNIIDTRPLPSQTEDKAQDQAEMLHYGADDEGAPLNLGDVVIVSGGARGVTAEIAVQVAENFQPTLVILGRSNEPSVEPAWLNGITSENGIKSAIAKHGNQDMSLADLQNAFVAVVNNREMMQTFTRIKRAGSVLIYRAVDIRDQAAVTKVIREIETKVGRVRGFIHGAGVLQDRLIKDKTVQQFRDVFGTKVQGFCHVMAAIDPTKLKLLALFSSSTARYGRRGQCDYAAGNEILNKLADHYAVQLSPCRVVAFNWGPWQGGMVTPSLAKIFNDEGIDLIPLGAGGRCFIDEITAPSPASSPRHVELVVHGKKVEKVAQPTPSVRTPHEPFALFSWDISAQEQPFLASHVINGKLVVPVVLLVEWLGHAALHDNPGMVFHGFDDLKVLRGIILDGGDVRKVYAYCKPAVRNLGVYEVVAEIRSVDAQSQEIRHASCKVLLTDLLPDSLHKPMTLSFEHAYDKDINQVYRDMLFHGEQMRGITAMQGFSEQGCQLQVKAAPSPALWLKNPLRGHWLADPLALDSAFQAVVIWTREFYGRASLPCAIRSYRQYRSSFPQNGCSVRVRPIRKADKLVHADIEFVDAGDKLVAKIACYEAVMDESLNEAFKRRTISQDRIATNETL